jgi:O-antigen/teichoic acid export membrane protein
VVSAISSAHQTGYYSTSFKAVEVLGGLAWLIPGSAFPLFARAGRDDQERLRYALGRVSDTALVAGTYLSLSLVVAAPFVIRVIGGKAFAPAVPVLRVQAVALLGGFIAVTGSYALLALRMHGAILRATLIALVASIGLCSLLVPGLGAEGAALATAASEFVVAGGYIYALLRRHPHLRPSMRALPRIAIAAAVALTVLVSGLPSIVMWGIASVAYFGLLLLMHAVPPELAQLLPGRKPPGAR